MVQHSSPVVLLYFDALPCLAIQLLFELVVQFAHAIGATLHLNEHGGSGRQKGLRSEERRVGKE